MIGTMSHRLAPGEPAKPAVVPAPERRSRLLGLLRGQPQRVARDPGIASSFGPNGRRICHKCAFYELDADACCLPCENDGAAW